MADVKWIKLTVDMFDNRKIKHIRHLPEGNNIVLIWVMLLTLAGRCNASGMIFLTENIPYTTKMLADELNFEETTIQLALKALEQFNMIVMQDGCIAIAGWEEHQNVEGLEKIREQNRLRKQKQRSKKKLLGGVSRDNHGTVTQCHATDIEKEREKEKEDKKDKIDKSAVALFEPHPMTKELVKCGYIESDDINIDLYNDVIQEVIDWYSLEIARSCVWYFVKRYKNNQTDENGNEIENKLAYFREALLCGAERLQRENNRSFSVG